MYLTTFNWVIYIYLILYINISKSKVGDLSRGQPEGSFFNSNYTEVTPFPGLLHFTLNPKFFTK